MSGSTRLTSARRACPARGFVLLPVAILLSLVAAATFLINREAALGAGRAGRAADANTARHVAEAGLAHARWTANASTCSAYALPPTAFGAHSYQATFTPAAGSPITIAATGTLANGIVRTQSLERVRVYESQTSTTFVMSPSSGKDTYVNEQKRFENYGASPQVAIDNGGAHDYYTLLEFDLSSLPPSAEVTEATLELFLESFGSTNTNAKFTLYRMLEPWVEGTGTGSATGDGANYDTSDGSTPWTWPATYDPTPVAVRYVDPSFSGRHSWDITPLVVGWVAGTYSNDGLVIIGNNQVRDAFFTSREGTVAENHPRLHVTYSCECGGGPGATVVLQPGIAGFDTYVDDGFNLQNFGADAEMRLSNKTNNKERALLRFDLPSIPPAAIVSAATLELNLEGIGSSNSGTVDVHRVTEDWVEGSGGGTTCWDGASWLERDGACGPWSTAGGTYDAAVQASAPIDYLSPGPVTWDLTSLVSSWIDGTYFNQGMILMPSVDINHADFTSGDAADASRHPKLTVSYSCPCGVPCTPPVTVGEDLLMVVVNPANLTAQEDAKKALIESWGFTVSLIDSSASQSAYDTALAANDVVFVTEDVNAGDIGTKLTGGATGVVTEEDNLSDELGLADSIHWGSGQELTITDNTHYVTLPFALAPLAFTSATESLADVTGTLAPDLALLGASLDGPALVAIEKGATLIGGGFAAGRRVQLPWGGNNFDVNNLTDDGRTLFQRALEWGATDSGVIVAAYVDQFSSGSCDPGVAYAGSDGNVDWSGQAWSEIGDAGDPCASEVKLQQDLGDQSLRILGDGSGAQRGADLSGATFATLALDYRRIDFDDAGDYVVVEITDGVGGWSELGRFEGPADDGAYQNASWDIAPWMGPDTAIRVVAYGLGGTGAGIDSFFLDNVVIDTDAAGGGSGPSCTATVADDVESGDYAGDTGTLPWGGPWQEHNEADGPAAGDERVVSLAGDLAFQVSDNDGGGEGLWRAADISGFTSATLGFDYWRDGLDDTNDYVAVEASGDGGLNWNELDRFQGAAADVAWQQASYDVGAYIGTGFALRFVSSSMLGNSDRVYFDDIEICLD